MHMMLLLKSRQRHKLCTTTFRKQLYSPMLFCRPVALAPSARSRLLPPASRAASEGLCSGCRLAYMGKIMQESALTEHTANSSTLR